MRASFHSDCCVAYNVTRTLFQRCVAIALRNDLQMVFLNAQLCCARQDPRGEDSEAGRQAVSRNASL